ncbi:MAG: hypothetical protein RLZ81_437 [Pseudomonadota bacterium]|jgi:hypothetical protein
MTDFIIKKLSYDRSSNAGLALVGKYLRTGKLSTLVDAQFAVRSGVTNSDILKSYLALLGLGKNDFYAIKDFRGDAFYMRALGLRAVPSSPTLCQRLDSQASDWFGLSERINQAVLSQHVNCKPIEFGALPCGYTPIDRDTFAMDNGNTKMELVGRTYPGVNRYCPLVVYLGTLGFCLELALRPELQHSVRETGYNLGRNLSMAAGLTPGP